MPIKAKHNGSYKDITDLMNVDESIDYVLAKTSSSYKRVYTATRSIEDTPPTTFKSIKSGANLTDYRIYGQTVDGESVGDRTGNLFDYVTMSKGLTSTYINADGDEVNSSGWSVSDYIPCDGTVFTLGTKTNMGYLPAICVYDDNKHYITGAAYNGRTTITVSADQNAKYIRFSYTNSFDLSAVMLNAGSTALPYEPYGYKVPVTVEGKNLFDMKKFAETAYPQNATVNYSENSLIFTATQIDAYVNQVYSQLTIPVALRSSCINVQPLTTYTISMNAPYKCFISWLNDSFEPVAEYTDIPNNQTSYTFTTPSNCTKLLFRLGKHVTNIGDTFTISNIMLNAGAEPIPYEPYHAPVTTPIYLPEQIRKDGDEAEYIDYSEQKLYRVRKNLFYITKFTNNNTQSTAQGVNFSIIDNEVYANGTSTGMYPQASGFDYVLTEGETYAATLYIEGEYTGLPYIYCTTTYDSAGNYQKVPPNVRTIFTALPGTRILFVAHGIGENFNIKYKLLITKATIEDDTYEPYIENTDLDVTLPALPTLAGTNTLSVGTEVQPSKIDITGHIKTISGGS